MLTAAKEASISVCFSIFGITEKVVDEFLEGLHLGVRNNYQLDFRGDVCIQ